MIFCPLGFIWAEELGLSDTTDIFSPIIRHNPVQETLKMGASHEITARISDNIGVREATLYYRTHGQEPYSALKMNDIGQENYRAVIPKEDIVLPGLEYYIQVKDYAGNISQRGFPFSPLRLFVVVEPDEVRVEASDNVMKKQRMKDLVPQTKKNLSSMRHSGLFLSDWNVGFMVGAELVSVDDPEGKTVLEKHLSYLNVVAVFKLRPARRILTHLSHNMFTLTKTKNKVSSRVKSFGFNVSYQVQTQWSGPWNPWLGAGLGISQDRFDNRIKFDNDAFVVKRFDDLEITAVSFLVNASNQIITWKSLNLEVHTQIEFPISGDITRLNVFGMLLF